MAKQNLGRVAMVNRGEWQSGQTYNRLDIVVYNGSSYTPVKDNVTSQPPSADWTLLAAKGDKGEPGEPGEPGANGKAATIQIGTVTTGEPGTDASVENVGSATDVRLNFTIPRGADGQGGSGGMQSVSVSAPLTGDGTSDSPLGIGVIPIEKGGTGATDVKDAGIKLFKGNIDASGTNLSDSSKILIYQSAANEPQSVFAYKLGSNIWGYIQSKIEAAYPDIKQIVSLVAKVQALEAAKNPVELDEGADISSIINTSGTYIKLYGKTAVNGPTADYNKAESKYVITVINNYGDAYQEIDPIAGVSDIYYRTKNSGGSSPWYKVSATTQQ